MVKVLITGGTGLIGKHLQKTLHKHQIETIVLTRNPKQKNEFKWDIENNYIDENAFNKVTHIIHLAGAGIAEKRWTEKRKKELIDSRVKSTNLIYRKVKECNIKLHGFISASAIGYYGAITTNHIFTEDDKPHEDFIANICVKWEKAAHQFKALNIPVTILRTGIVLTKTGGALEKMNTPLFLSALGNGKQFMPWIHITDLCNLYLEAIKSTEFKGTFNAVTNDYTTNKNFTKTLGKVISKPVLPIGVPAFILKLMLGELANILLKGSKVSAAKTSKFYNFKFSNLKEALNDIYYG